MDISAVPFDKPEDLNVIVGQSHFIKTVEDLHEACVNVPGLKFGIAFNEASGPRLVRRSGNDDELVDVAVRNARAIGAGHLFVVALRDGFPIHVLNAVKAVPEVCRVFCATANPLEVVVGETEQGRGVLGVIDGSPPAGSRPMRTRPSASSCCAASGTSCERGPLAAGARRPAPGGARDLPAPGGGDPGRPVRRRQRRPLLEHLHEPADRTAPRLHRRAVARRSGAVGRSDARGRSRTGAGRASPVAHDRRPVPHGVPAARRRRARGLDPRRGRAGPRRERGPAVLARRHDRRHPDQARRGPPPQEPRRPAADDGGPPAAAPAAGGRTGGGAAADRVRHPRRPDPGDERRRHPCADRSPAASRTPSSGRRPRSCTT